MSSLRLINVSIKNVLQQAHAQLAESRSGEILLEFVLKKDRAYLYTYPEKILTQQEYDLFQALIARRAQGEPIAYLIGKKEFYSLSFKVTKDTLIPRPETETVVEQVLRLFPDNRPCQVLELATGSGTLAVTLAKLRPNWHILATDISEPALQVARDNAARYALQNIDFLLSDWYAKIPLQQFNLIVSNPPYIANDDPHLADLGFEPISALIAGTQGLDCLAIIIKSAKDYLLPDGWLVLEHGFDQAEAVQNLLHVAQFVKVITISDLSGMPRVTLGQKIC